MHHLFSCYYGRLNMFSALAVFSVFCLGLAASAPSRPDDITCKPVKYWDCKRGLGLPAGLPDCNNEEVCSKVKGKTQCRLLPRADKCLDNSGKVCTKKTGEVCTESKTPNTKTTTKKPVTTTKKKPVTTTTKKPVTTTKKPVTRPNTNTKKPTTTTKKPVTTTTKKPVTTTRASSDTSPLDFDDEVGCTTGEEIVCEATKQKTSSLPKVN